MAFPLASLLRSRGLGHLPDKPDDRDKALGDLLGVAIGLESLPFKASVSSGVVGPKNQGGTSSCTGQAISQAVRLAYLYRGRPCPELSALHNYHHGRAEWGGEGKDQGSYLRDGLKALIRFGIAPESDWAFSAWIVNRRPSWRADRAGFDYRGARGYYRLPDGDGDAVKRAIANGCPVVGGWKINRAFLDDAGSGLIGRQTGDVVGGHAICVEAYDGNVFEILNSWGSSWRSAGRARVTTEFVEDGQDLWAISV